jgi:Protein of unknown function (DUF3224)
MRAVASFEFDSFDEDPPYRADGGARHQRAHIEKTFRGEIEGHGSVEMLAARAAEGAGYVALEYITGTVNGRSGGFSLLHIGTMAGQETWARWPVVPGSGTGELRTIRGEGRIDIDAAGGHTFTLDYELD